jgi:O-antigen ligase/polysaccharide polymerase Wzy-like membrane protein
VRRAVPHLCAALLLAVPAALAPFDGGYGDVARLGAGVGVWALAGAAALTAPRPLPRGTAGRVALAGLAALAALTLLSVAWAPLRAPAYADAQRVVLYLGALAAAAALLGPRGAGRAVEPALALSAVGICVWGLSERLLPGVFTLHRSLTAGSRLAQPLGYWNAMGAVAAIGLVLCAALAGDATRARRLRIAAAAAAPVLGAAIALTFSRGALLVGAVGLAVLLATRPERIQLRMAATAAAAALAAGVVAAALPGVTKLSGAHRAAEGLVLLAAIGVAGAAAARVAGGEGRRRAGRLEVRHGRALTLAALVAVLGAGAVLVASDGGPRTGDPRFGATARRLGSVKSTRYAYWRVAVQTWAHHPVAGEGSSAFAVEWLRRREVAEGARDAHSLPLETAAELGLLGLAALAALAGGVAAAARRLQRRAPGVAAGAFAGLAGWSVHACIDWAWEMPTVTLLALLLAGSVLAAAED